MTSSDTRLVSFEWITGKVRGGDHAVVLDYICARWDAEVEPIKPWQSWGFASRDVRGNAGIISEHATGCAVDINAPLHPLGVATNKTLTRKQIRTIRRIIKDVDGAARWGGEWSRPDAMHIELMGGNAKIKQVADKIRAGALGNVKPTGGKSSPSQTKPSTKPTDFKDLAVDGVMGKQTVKAVQIVMTAIDEYHRAIDGKAGYYTWAAVQNWLRGLGYYPQDQWRIDGDPGPATIRALQQFLAKKGHLDTRKWLIDGKLGPATIRAFQSYLNTQNHMK
ncbi:M15 family metallopeptidase [Glutamicibacter sp. X7]